MVEVSGILADLEYLGDAYPEAALEAAMAHREAITPHLIAVLRQVAADSGRYVADELYYLHLYAFMLLGRFREEAAHEAIIEVVSIPRYDVNPLFGDMIPEELPLVLFNTCGGDYDQIKGLVENRAANDFVRGAAAGALVYGVAAGQVPRQEALDFLGSLFTGSEAEVEAESAFWSLIGYAVLELYPQELRPILDEARERGLIDETFFDEDDIVATLEGSVEESLEKIRSSMESQALDNFHDRMAKWIDIDDLDLGYCAPPGGAGTKKSQHKKEKRKKQQAKKSRRKNRR